MKELIIKLRNKKYKGNISLLVILILLASSIIALLSINQIQHLLTYWNMTFNYFRSFYIAKAWTEFWLTEVYYREAWFQQTINSWDTIVTQNLVWAYSGFKPYFTMWIESNFINLTDDIRYTKRCDDNNRIILDSWEWIMISLFQDITSWIRNILSEWSQIKALDNIEIIKLETSNLKWYWWWKKEFTYWLFAYDNDYNMSNIVVETWTDLNSFLTNHTNSISWNRRYLTIKNSWTNKVWFCIRKKWWGYIPYSNSLIDVQANYADMEVWLQSIVKKETPSWSLNKLELE